MILAEEELYSAQFVYESIYEEIPVDVSQVQVEKLNYLELCLLFE